MNIFEEIYQEAFNDELQKIAVENDGQADYHKSLGKRWNDGESDIHKVKVVDGTKDGVYPKDVAGTQRWHPMIHHKSENISYM